MSDRISPESYTLHKVAEELTHPFAAVFPWRFGSGSKAVTRCETYYLFTTEYAQNMCLIMSVFRHRPYPAQYDTLYVETVLELYVENRHCSTALDLPSSVRNATRALYKKTKTIQAIRRTNNTKRTMPHNNKCSCGA